jgi:tetratricopeptide (TPR) repeat protein
LGSSDPDRALSLYERALEVDPNDADSKRAMALILRDRGDFEAAVERLDKLLEAHPHEAGAAAARAELDLERDRVDDRTLVVARQAVRFGRTAEDLSRLARVHTALGQTAEATQARLRAETLQEAAVRSPSGPPSPRAE